MYLSSRGTTPLSTSASISHKGPPPASKTSPGQTDMGGMCPAKSCRPHRRCHSPRASGSMRQDHERHGPASSGILSRVWAVPDGSTNTIFYHAYSLARVGGTRREICRSLKVTRKYSLARVGGPYLQVDIFDSQIPAPRPAPCPRLPKQRLKDRDLAPLARDPDDGGRLHSHFGNALPPSQNLDVLTNGNLKNCHRHAWTRL